MDREGTLEAGDGPGRGHPGGWRWTGRGDPGGWRWTGRGTLEAGVDGRWTLEAGDGGAELESSCPRMLRGVKELLRTRLPWALGMGSYESGL